MIRYLVVHGASLTATNALKRTASQLAADLNHVEALEALERVAETPFPRAARWCTYVCRGCGGAVELSAAARERAGSDAVGGGGDGLRVGATATLGATASWSEGESEISQSGLIAEEPGGSGAERACAVQELQRME